MPISAYVGLPRSGKSYSVVEHVVIPAAKQKRPIWTNIPLNDELLKADFDYEVTYFKTDDIKNNDTFFDDLPHGIVFILDEAWRLWPSGLKNSNARESDLAFLAEHGHRSKDGFSTEIILATQDLAQMATFARNLVETTYRTVKLSAVGSSKKFRVDVYQGCVTGPNPPERSRVDQLFGSYKEKVYKYYVSQTQSDGSHGSEKKSDSRGNILTGQWLWLSLILIAFLSIFVFFALSSVIDSYSSPGSNSNSSSSSDTVPSVSTSLPASLPSSSGSSDIPSDEYVFDDFDIFRDATNFYISFNMGVYPNIRYRFTVINNRYRTVLSVRDLHNLGYRIKPINECLVIIRYLSIQYTVMCQMPSQEPRSPFSLSAGESLEQDESEQ